MPQPIPLRQDLPDQFQELRVDFQRNPGMLQVQMDDHSRVLRRLHDNALDSLEDSVGDADPITKSRAYFSSHCSTRLDGQ